MSIQRIKEKADGEGLSINQIADKLINCYDNFSADLVQRNEICKGICEELDTKKLITAGIDRAKNDEIKYWRERALWIECQAKYWKERALHYKEKAKTFNEVIEWDR